MEEQLPQLHESYGKLCRRVASCAGDTSLTSKLTNSLHMKHASVFCVLTTTVRTHKAQGKVEHQNNHSSLVNSFAGLSMWYASALRFQLQNLEHILASTDVFVKRTDIYHFVARRFHDHNRCPTLFYEWNNRSSSVNFHSRITCWCSEVFITKMLGSFYCTTNTFVLEFANNRVWRVKQGSGMGLRHSGDLADLSMYNLCENSLGTVH